MAEALQEVQCMEGLRAHIHRVLSQKENLVAEQFALREIPLTRGSATCGCQFVLLGPRQVQLAAVWSAEQKTIFYYDACGERFLREDLHHAIEYSHQAAAA